VLKKIVSSPGYGAVAPHLPSADSRLSASGSFGAAEPGLLSSAVGGRNARQLAWLLTALALMAAGFVAAALLRRRVSSRS
jgi:hypothetical protein